MPIFAKNITVGAIKPAPTVTNNSQSFKDIKEHIKRKIEENAKEESLIEQPKKVVKQRTEVNHQPQVTKQLPKYISQEEGELTRKINTKSQYMRDIFDLDS